MSESFEYYLLEHCSPTFAGIKCASMVNIPCSDLSDVVSEIDMANAEFQAKKLAFKILRVKNGRVLVYVYRLGKLAEKFRNIDTQRFLAKYGYDATSCDIDSLLNRLIARMNVQNEFPHEIGIFLDYPLCDVIGFIENSGENHRAAGQWKVYGNIEEACKRFCMLKKCRNVYRRCHSRGKTLYDLTVG